MGKLKYIILLSLSSSMSFSLFLHPQSTQATTTINNHQNHIHIPKKPNKKIHIIPILKSQSHTQIQKITYPDLPTQIFKTADPPIMTTTTTTNLHFGGQKFAK